MIPKSNFLQFTININFMLTSNDERNGLNLSIARSSVAVAPEQGLETALGFTKIKNLNDSPKWAKIFLKSRTFRG